jgi:FAD/FMN-containing dehydrogenase
MSIIHHFPNWGFLLALLISITSIAFANLPPAPHPKALFTTTTDTHPLLHHLSPTAQLLLPSTPEFTAFLTANNETERWSTSPVNSPPPPSLIVIPATESDISATIRYANAHDLPFLASPGGHGTTMWLATMPRGGVLIYMRSLTKLEVVERRSHPRHNSRPDSDADSDHDDDDDDDYDGKGDGGRSGMTAILGGGLLAGEVVDQLWALGLQTTTGVCGCVSYSGPPLGGGHGLLQGRYGLAADQVVSARVVLGDGEVVEVSEEENADLFWALRGAGHNFGVVSEWKVRV